MSEQFKRVLVVDDDPAVRHILTTVLGQHSLQVDEAADGSQALELLRLHPYSVILLDLLMPGEDGFAVLEGMKSDGFPPSSPVVLVLTGADHNVTERLDPQRIHGVVKKPFDPNEIASIVVACSEIKSRNAFGTMAIATMLGGAPILAWLQNGKI